MPAAISQPYLHVLCISWYIHNRSVIRAMYEYVTTKVRLNGRVRLSMLRWRIFKTVFMDNICQEMISMMGYIRALFSVHCCSSSLSRQFKEGLPMELLLF